MDRLIAENVELPLFAGSYSGVIKKNGSTTVKRDLNTEGDPADRMYRKKTQVNLDTTRRNTVCLS